MPDRNNVDGKGGRLEVDTVATLAGLTPDPRNARRHTPRNVGLIVDALHEVGAARSIVIDEDNVILAGNATVDAAAQAGIERVRVVDAKGDELIAVRRSNLSPEQKRRLALFDNRTAELAEWDEAVLASLVEDTDLSGIFRDDELAEVLSALPDVAFKEYDESAADDVAYAECPNCGHRFPK